MWDVFLPQRSQANAGVGTLVHWIRKLRRCNNMQKALAKHVVQGNPNTARGDKLGCRSKGPKPRVLMGSVNPHFFGSHSTHDPGDKGAA